VTTITNEDGEKKEFAFDYSFWSHDGFNLRDDGYAEPISSKYID
jgi:hypothetical protein